MLTLEQLKVVVHQKGLTKTDTCLLCVAAGGGARVQTVAAKKYAIDAGVKGAKKWNFGAFLSAVDDKVFRTPDGWELTEVGKSHIASVAGENLSVSPAAKEAQDLRAILPKLKHQDVKDFLSEAIVCAEQSLPRAAIVLSWVGAIAIMQREVVDKHLTAFNAETLKRDPKWKAAKTTDDLGRLKESTFLEVAQTVGLIGKNVKQELDACLKLRNGCGHPNSLKVGSNKVAAHIETLALNVYVVFS
ncbi:hypothetical protein [Luteimonas terricola]|uniref:DUF4145 domain-containing protein n=1 Tax=Luteimonas terricola TaxID=645597 RepID=A0ABQ2EN55_9GAMM|nr:hypothetical protein [Luteimonas terricola]GGK17237.1 hypothetical protein GCM10011394_28050 [Luteimonas terricola]